MELITCCTFLWWDPQGRRNRQYVYTAQEVNKRKRAIDRWLTVPHEHVCVTDMPEGLDPDIRVAPLDRSLLAPSTRFPKLQLFAPEAAQLIGERILYYDLDSLPVGPLDHLVTRDDDCVLWANPRYGLPRATRINTSIMLLRAGTRPHVLERFDLEEGVRRAWPKMAGTDQVWISEALPHEPTWDQRDGIYWIGELRDGRLPDNACFVTFAGRWHPDQPETRARHPWIKRHSEGLECAS